MKRFISHCPDCGAPTSVADEAYCANSDCLWNNKPSTSTPPATNTAPAGVPPTVDDGRGGCTLTIDQPYARMYVDGVVRSYRSAALLKAAYFKSNSRTGFDPEKCTPYALALWDGYWAVLQELNAFVRNAVNHGVLLHLVPA